MSSFKGQSWLSESRHPAYRTPSPPPRSEIEPATSVLKSRGGPSSRARYGASHETEDWRSPTKSASFAPVQLPNGSSAVQLRSSGSTGVDDQPHSKFQLAHSAMDAFATIALATSQSPTYLGSGHHALQDRPWKRARVESWGQEAAVAPQATANHNLRAETDKGNGPSPMDLSADVGSLTLAGGHTSITADAELLLNVSRAVILSPTTSRPRTMHGAQQHNALGRTANHLRSSSESSLVSRPVLLPMHQSASGQMIPPQDHQGKNGYPDAVVGHENQGQASLLQDTSIKFSVTTKEDSGHGTVVAGTSEWSSTAASNHGQPFSPIDRLASAIGCAAPRKRTAQDGLSVSTSQPGPSRGGILSEGRPSALIPGEASGLKHRSSSVGDRNGNGLAEAVHQSTAGFIRHVSSMEHKGDEHVLGNARRRNSIAEARFDQTFSFQRRQSAPEALSGFWPSKGDGVAVPAEDLRPVPAAVNLTTANPIEPSADHPMPSLQGGDAKSVGPASSCADCQMITGATLTENDEDGSSWIRCDGCQRWFHFACAGLTENEVRTVDKFICEQCRPTHGPTTYVRKSSRAHTAIDYAGLNEGVVKTSKASPHHPYIKPLKERSIRFLPDNFARLAPENVTSDFFEKGDGMKEPVVIPEWMNPQRKDMATGDEGMVNGSSVDSVDSPLYTSKEAIEAWLRQDYQYCRVPDDGQDKLDMVIPQGLTVRRVADLYGPQEKVDVIDVKSQGEAGSWNLKKWADYYESTKRPVIRNVISLEVSTSKLGRLIRRPKVVRQLDLVDSVWPTELKAKGDFPKVQLYCLMSVADSYTDFHVDFGGSSVFYHIIKGKKTFLFIPPKSKNLKKYEQWCLSPAQNQTFLPDLTKECIRVDLSAGDTMLIPSGWVHAVWTPEDSLVIGGNFLTRMHYGMQIQIAEIEKITKVPRKFRHPHFQRVLWFTAIEYLKHDPLPQDVEDLLSRGEPFPRELPTYLDLMGSGASAEPGTAAHHSRYYSRSELDGLPDLTRYLLRTVWIAQGKLTDGITADTRQRVGRAIPKGYGDPLKTVKRFAMWSAWKRGNETVPDWAYPDAELGQGLPPALEKKPSAAAIRKMEREAAAAVNQLVPRRKSNRNKATVEASVPDVPMVDAGDDNGAKGGLNGGQQESFPGSAEHARVEQTPDTRSLGDPGPVTAAANEARDILKAEATLPGDLDTLDKAQSSPCEGAGNGGVDGDNNPQDGVVLSNGLTTSISHDQPVRPVENAARSPKPKMSEAHKDSSVNGAGRPDDDASGTIKFTTPTKRKRAGSTATKPGSAKKRRNTIEVQIPVAKGSPPEDVPEKSVGFARAVEVVVPLARTQDIDMALQDKAAPEEQANGLSTVRREDEPVRSPANSSQGESAAGRPMTNGVNAANDDPTPPSQAVKVEEAEYDDPAEGLDSTEKHDYAHTMKVDEGRDARSSADETVALVSKVTNSQVAIPDHLLTEAGTDQARQQPNGVLLSEAAKNIHPEPITAETSAGDDNNNEGARLASPLSSPLSELDMSYSPRAPTPSPLSASPTTEVPSAGRNSHSVKRKLEVASNELNESMQSTMDASSSSTRAKRRKTSISVTVPRTTRARSSQESSTQNSVQGGRRRSQRLAETITTTTTTMTKTTTTTTQQSPPAPLATTITTTAKNKKRKLSAPTPQGTRSPSATASRANTRASSNTVTQEPNKKRARKSVIALDTSTAAAPPPPPSSSPPPSSAKKDVAATAIAKPTKANEGDGVDGREGENIDHDDHDDGEEAEAKTLRLVKELAFGLRHR